MANREVDPALAMLIHTEFAAGGEGLTDAISDLSEADVRRLLALAVVEIMESRADAERDFERLRRRFLDSQKRTP